MGASTRPSADQVSTKPPALFVRASTLSPVNAIGVSGAGFGSSVAPTVTLAVTVDCRPNVVCTYSTSTAHSGIPVFSSRAWVSEGRRFPSGVSIHSITASTIPVPVIGCRMLSTA